MALKHRLRERMGIPKQTLMKRIGIPFKHGLSKRIGIPLTKRPNKKDMDPLKKNGLSKRIGIPVNKKMPFKKDRNPL